MSRQIALNGIFAGAVGVIAQIVWAEHPACSLVMVAAFLGMLVNSLVPENGMPNDQAHT
jgi:hypothetical protein